MSIDRQQLIHIANTLNLEDLKFLLRVWQDRIFVFNHKTDSCDNIISIKLNGTCLQINLQDD